MDLNKIWTRRGSSAVFIPKSSSTKNHSRAWKYSYKFQTQRNAIYLNNKYPAYSIYAFLSFFQILSVSFYIKKSLQIHFSYVLHSSQSHNAKITSLLKIICSLPMCISRVLVYNACLPWWRLKAGGEGDDRGQDGQVASLTQWTWVWTSSRGWW